MESLSGCRHQAVGILWKSSRPLTYFLSLGRSDADTQPEPSPVSEWQRLEEARLAVLRSWLASLLYYQPE